MQKTIKIIAGFIGALILLAIVAIVVVVNLINPNDYKDQINQKVQEATGRQLTLQGDIHWSFFPWLSLEINEAQLSNAPGFGDQPFAVVKKADASVELLPLLKGKIELGKLLLDGFELHLIKNAKGVTNWQDLLERSAKKKIAEVSTEATSPVKSVGYFSAFALAGIDIKDGHITWQDQQQNKFYDVSNLQLQSRSVQLGESFPIKFGFILQSKAPKIDKFTVSLQSDVTVAADANSVELAQLHISLNDNTLTGNIVINDLTAKTLLAKGRLQADSLQVGKFNPTKVDLQFKATNNVINISPITANIYQGSYQGAVNIDINSAVPKISSDTQLNNIQVEPLLHDMANLTRLQLTGVGNLTAHLTTQTDNLVNHLSGQGKIALKNGVIKGIDILYWVNTARALIKKEALPSRRANETDFGNLTGTFVVTNGVLRNNDLFLRLANVEANGKGTADLVKQRLDYQLDAQLLRSNGQPDGTMIPLQISGSFSDIKIRPNVESLLKEQVKERIGAEIGKHFDKDLGDKLQNTLDSLFK